MMTDENNDDASIKTVAAQLRWVTHQLSRIETKVEKLEAFKWQLIGAGTIIGVIVAWLSEFSFKK